MDTDAHTLILSYAHINGLLLSISFSHFKYLYVYSPMYSTHTVIKMCRSDTTFERVTGEATFIWLQRLRSRGWEGINQQVNSQLLKLEGGKMDGFVDLRATR